MKRQKLPPLVNGRNCMVGSQRGDSFALANEEPINVDQKPEGSLAFPGRGPKP